MMCWTAGCCLAMQPLGLRKGVSSATTSAARKFITGEFVPPVARVHMERAMYAPDCVITGSRTHEHPTHIKRPTLSKQAHASSDGLQLIVCKHFYQGKFIRLECMNTTLLRGIKNALDTALDSKQARTVEGGFGALSTSNAAGCMFEGTNGGEGCVGCGGSEVSAAMSSTSV